MSLVNSKVYYGIIIALWIVMSLGMASADQTLGVFKQYECVSLTTTCANCTFVNVTSIIYPNSSQALSTQAVMTKTGTEYNYTFCNTANLGTYIYNTLGDPSGVPTVQPVTFEITSTGNNKSLYLPLILGISAMLLLVAGIFVRNAFLGLFSAFLFIILGIYSMIYGLGVIQDAYTQMVSYVIIGLGVVIGFASTYELYEEGED